MAAEVAQNVEEVVPETDPCTDLKSEFGNCASQSFDDYQAALNKGDDGRPDWLARKACNYMTSTIEDCTNIMVGECFSEEQVTVMKDKQVKIVLTQTKSSIEEWDTDKCPVSKA